MLSKDFMGIAVHAPALDTPNQEVGKTVFSLLKHREGAPGESFVISGVTSIKGDQHLILQWRPPVIPNQADPCLEMSPEKSACQRF